MPNPASLRSDRWQLSPGMGGRLRVDWVAAFAPESVAAFNGILREREQETLYVLGNRSLMEQITRSAKTHAVSAGYRPTPEQLDEIDRL